MNCLISLGNAILLDWLPFLQAVLPCNSIHSAETKAELLTFVSCSTTGTSDCTRMNAMTQKRKKRIYIQRVVVRLKWCRKPERFRLRKWLDKLDKPRPSQVQFSFPLGTNKTKWTVKKQGMNALFNVKSARIWRIRLKYVKSLFACLHCFSDLLPDVGTGWELLWTSV